jgi:sulfonate transport system ATP-binding protein
MAELLEANIAEKSFGPKRVLNGVRFSLQAGEIVTLVGASGCGKSTLLRLIAGLEKTYRGTIKLDGQTLNGMRRDIGFIFQEARLFPWLSVAKNIGFSAGDVDSANTHIQKLLDEVDLVGYADALPKQLSGGQAQRVAIARGLFTKPRVLLLDEPFSAVDAFTRMKLQDLLLSLAAEHGITVLLFTHDIEEAAYLSNRSLVMGRGEIIDDIEVNPQRPLPAKRDRRSESLVVARNRILEVLQSIHAI